MSLFLIWVTTATMTYSLSEQLLDSLATIRAERERERVSCCQPGPRTLRYSSRSRVQYCTFPLCRPFWVKFNFSRENVQQIFKIYSWYCVADIYSFGYLKYLYLRIQIPTLLQDIKENHREILPPKAELILSTWRNLAPNFLWRYK